MIVPARERDDERHGLRRDARQRAADACRLGIHIARRRDDQHPVRPETPPRASERLP